jgi:membrane protease YdiL (CAAX protease family)
MKGYIVTSGVIFALLALSHVARVALESWRLAREPEYIVITLAAAAMAVWAYRAYRRIEPSR